MSIKNFKTLLVALGVTIVGILCVVVDGSIQTANGWLNNIGCSLIASSVFAILNAAYVEYRVEKPVEKWKLTEIFRTRAEKNQDSDPKLHHVKYRIDGVAFGLRSFRSKHTEPIEDCLRREVQIRLITMNPSSSFADQRDSEEHENEGNTKNSINNLVEWADELNDKGYKGKIEIKGYSCMTLDFYWRVDDDLYIGPYWYGVPSQQTITMKFIAGGIGFEEYAAYFERLWNDNDIMQKLTK